MGNLKYHVFNNHEKMIIVKCDTSKQDIARYLFYVLQSHRKGDFSSSHLSLKGIRDKLIKIWEK